MPASSSYRRGPTPPVDARDNGSSNASGCIFCGKSYTPLVVTEPRRDTGIPGDSFQGDPILPAGDLIQMIWRRWPVVLLTMVVCVGMAAGYSLLQTPLYQASIKVLVGQDRGILSDPAQAENLQTVAMTLSETVTTRPVGERVVQDLGLNWPPEAITAGTTAEPIPDTQYIQITYTDTDPRRAQRTVNAIGDAFSEEISELSSQAGAVSVTVWERAEVTPQAPVSPNTLRNILMAFVVGGMLGLGLAILLDYLDDSWRSPEEAEQVSGVPTLGVIPKSRERKAKRSERSRAI